MGKRKAISAVPVPDTTFMEFCGCCNKKFTPTLRKTRKFVINVAESQREVGLILLNTDSSCSDEPEQPQQNEIVDVNTGLEEILKWRYQASFAGGVDPKLGLCPTCGLIVAKLYSAIKLFDKVKVEESFLDKVVQNTLRKETKETDTDRDAQEEAAAAAEIEAAVFLAEYYPETEVEVDGERVVTRSKRTDDKSTKEFQCQYCTAGFDKHSNLTRHLLLTHEIGEKEKEFRCGVCGKEYYFSYLLKNHELIHGEQRPFVCKVPNCQSAFKNKLGLHNHMKFFHRKSRPFKCNFCTKSFKDTRAHRNHEHYVHTIPMGLKPHVCEYCGEHFKRLSSLPGHIKKKCRKNPNRVIGIEEEEEAAIETITLDDHEREAVVLAIPGNQIEVEQEITLSLITQ